MNFKQLIIEIYNHLDDYEEVQNPVDYIRENVNVYIIGDDNENFYFKKKNNRKENFMIEFHQLELKYNDIIKYLGVEYKDKEKQNDK